MNATILNNKKQIPNEDSRNIEDITIEYHNNELNKNNKKIEKISNEKKDKNNNVEKEVQNIKKVKRVFDNTENGIEGEYNKITDQSKINKKTLSVYTFCYKKMK